ncbi:MAG: aminodeoxychorismate lyase [Myxococcales bacterium]|mgnify:CR=1 FL=1|nr:aminodeoxychorismate lyase [Myxococcales bacterium]
MKALIKGFLALLVIGCIVIGAGAYWLHGQATALLTTPLSVLGEEHTFVVDKGMSTRGVLRRLDREGISDEIEWSWIGFGRLSDSDWRWVALRLYARDGHDLPVVKVGEYRVDSGWTMLELLEHLASGKVITYAVTVPEGLRVDEICRKLSKSPLFEYQALRKATRSKPFADQLGLPGLPAKIANHPQAERFEGWLFPTRYDVPRGTTERKMLEIMVRQTQTVLARPKVQEGMRRHGWKESTVLKLASVVEKETADPSERPEISAVFHNRLRLGMKLQTDPTIIYGLVNYQGDIRRRDILDPHPWNLYVHHGLPITPIAAPGAEAIEAAVAPNVSRNLYFVSRNDRTHEFCPTLRCHNRAVKKWQIDYFRKKRSGR